MLPIRKLSVVQPHLCKPGTLLIRNARYERDPILVCGMEKSLNVLRLPVKEPKLFDIQLMAQDSGPHIALDSFEVLCDPSNIISPNRSDIPFGAMCLVDDKPRIAAKFNHATVYVGLDGEVHEESFENFVAFERWKIVTNTSGDNFETVFEHEAKPTGS